VEKSDARLDITAMPAKHATDDALASMLMPVNGHILDFSRDGRQLYRLYITDITKPRVAIPIHYNDYSVFMSGLADFKEAAAKSTASTEFHYLTQGDTYRFNSAT
jgi:hypothetical protein